MMSTEDIYQKIWCWQPRREEMSRMQECRDASTKLLELIWVDTDKSVNPTHKKDSIDTV